MLNKSESKLRLSYTVDRPDLTLDSPLKVTLSLLQKTESKVFATFEYTGRVDENLEFTVPDSDPRWTQMELNLSRCYVPINLGHSMDRRVLGVNQFSCLSGEEECKN